MLSIGLVAAAATVWLAMLFGTALFAERSAGVLARHWKHVYALSLPLARWEYALLKFAAGVTLVLIPVVALLAGTLLGLAGLDVPDGLHAYPFAFTFRFMLAVLIAYAAAFAAAAFTLAWSKDSTSAVASKNVDWDAEVAMSTRPFTLPATLEEKVTVVAVPPK